MGRMKSTNVWIYFTAVDEEKKVKCKLCYKYLMGKRSYNLKKHLKSAHKIEVRSTDRRRSPNKKFKHSDDLNDDAGSDYEQNPNDTNEFENSTMQQYTILEEGQENNDDNFYDITTQQMDQTNDSEGHDSCSILPTNSSVIDIKEELVQENTDLRNNTSVNEPSIEVDNESLRNNANTSKPTENCTTNNNTHTVSTPPPLIKYIKAPIRVLESLSKSTKPAKQSNHIKPPLRKRKITTLDNDPLEENINTECNSSDNSNKDPSAEFKEWSVKKKELLEIELLEMRNYKYKLELWQKEKELQVECSKYTKDIRGNK